MPSPLRTVTFDCADSYTLTKFWSGVAGAPISEDSGPGEDEAYTDTPAANPGSCSCEPPRAKVAKNRAHLDLRPNGDVTLDGEMERLVGLGTTVLADFRRPGGKESMVLADPEGNEFRVERGDAELGP